MRAATTPPSCPAHLDWHAPHLSSARHAPELPHARAGNHWKYVANAGRDGQGLTEAELHTLCVNTRDLHSNFSVLDSAQDRSSHVAPPSSCRCRSNLQCPWLNSIVILQVKPCPMAEFNCLQRQAANVEIRSNSLHSSVAGRCKHDATA